MEADKDKAKDTANKDTALSRELTVGLLRKSMEAEETRYSGEYGSQAIDWC